MQNNNSCMYMEQQPPTMQFNMTILNCKQFFCIFFNFSFYSEQSLIQNDLEDNMR